MKTASRLLKHEVKFKCTLTTAGAIAAFENSLDINQPTSDNRRQTSNHGDPKSSLNRSTEFAASDYSLERPLRRVERKRRQLILDKKVHLVFYEPCTLRKLVSSMLLSTNCINYTLSIDFLFR